MKAIQLIKQLQLWPLFTINDLTKYLRQDVRYVRLIAHRLKKQGQIQQIERGKYTVHYDPLVFATAITTPSYISFWTALMLHKLTEQLPQTIMVAVPHSRKPIQTWQAMITFTQIRQFWGYAKMRYLDFDIFVADKEKAIIDCILTRNVPFDEIQKAIAHTDVNLATLFRYAKKTGSGVVIKRVGFLAESLGFRARVPTLDANYTPLDWSRNSKGEKNRRWKIIVNREVNHD